MRLSLSGLICAAQTIPPTGTVELASGCPMRTSAAFNPASASAFCNADVRGLSAVRKGVRTGLRTVPAGPPTGAGPPGTLSLPGTLMRMKSAAADALVPLGSCVGGEPSRPVSECAGAPMVTSATPSANTTPLLVKTSWLDSVMGAPVPTVIRSTGVAPLAPWTPYLTTLVPGWPPASADSRRGPGTSILRALAAPRAPNSVTDASVWVVCLSSPEFGLDTVSPDRVVGLTRSVREGDCDVPPRPITGGFPAVGVRILRRRLALDRC